MSIVFDIFYDCVIVPIGSQRFYDRLSNFHHHSCLLLMRRFYYKHGFVWFLTVIQIEFGIKSVAISQLQMSKPLLAVSLSLEEIHFSIEKRTYRTLKMYEYVNVHKLNWNVYRNFAERYWHKPKNSILF